MKQRLFSGYGSIDNLGHLLSSLSAKRVFIVTGKKSFDSSGVAAQLDRELNGIKVRRFCEINPNPTLQEVELGVNLYCREDVDVVLAVGGGSVIDVAKLINFFGNNRIEPGKWLKGALSDVQKGKPLIVIPTTAGSGSEATHFAVLYVDQKKKSVAHRHILPDFVILDPSFTMSLTPYLTAVSGIDALAQGIESFWSIHSNEQTKVFSRKAVELVFSNIDAATNKPSEFNRLNMLEASYLAGRAINRTRTTAVHAISYPLTSHFGIPHGHAVGLTLSSILLYNYNVSEEDLLDPRGCDYVRRTIREIVATLGYESVTEGKEGLDELLKSIGLEGKLSELGLGKADIEVVIENGFDPERVANNPRRLTRETLKEILLSIY